MEVKMPVRDVINFLLKKYEEKLEKNGCLVADNFLDQVELPCESKTPTVVRFDESDDVVVLSADKATLITISANLPTNTTLFDKFFNCMKNAIKKGY